MVINKNYIDYNNDLILDGYSKLTLKSLNFISLTGRSNNTINYDIISYRHYMTIIQEFGKLYNEWFNKSQELIYIYLTAPNDEFLVNGSETSVVINYLVSEDGSFLVDVLPGMKDLIDKYSSGEDENTIVKLIDGNYEDNGFTSEYTLKKKIEYLQDEIINEFGTITESTFKSYSNAVKGCIEILIKYGTLSRQKANNIGSKYGVSFKVVTSSNTPVENALIKININNNMITLFTNDQGLASTSLLDGSYSYTITSNIGDIVEGNLIVAGAPISENVIVQTVWILNTGIWSNSGVWNNSELWDSPEYIGSIFVKDPLDVPIEGAIVNIGGNSLITDPLGRVDIYLSDGTFTYEVVALGYNTVSSYISINGTAGSSTINMVETLWDIEFEVLDEFGSPVEGAEINIED